MEQKILPQFPRIWWHNGQYEMGTNGYFYTTGKEFEGWPGSPLETWEPVQLPYHEAGFKTTELRLAVIRRRSQAFVDEMVNGGRKRIWKDRSERSTNVRYYTELLCMMENFTGLVTLNIKGLTGGVFTDRHNGILIRHSRDVRDREDNATPSWAFWMHLRAPVDANGNILYTKTQNGTFATPPQLIPDGPATPEQLSDLWVGSERLEFGQLAFEGTREWQAYTRTNREEGQVW